MKCFFENDTRYETSIFSCNKENLTKFSVNLKHFWFRENLKHKDIDLNVWYNYEHDFSFYIFVKINAL